MKINLMHGFYYSFSSMLSLKCSFTFSIQQLLNRIYLGGAYGNLAVSGSKEQKICCSLSSYYYITFSLLWHLFLHILHSHANTSHQLFSTCSGIRYIQCAAVTPPLSPTQCSFLGPLYSLYICTYIYILCALCIMRHVVQMKIKNTSGNFCLNPQHRLRPAVPRLVQGFSIWRWKHLAFFSLSIFTLVPKQFVRLSAHAFLGT